MSKEKIVGIALIIIGLVLNFSTIKFPAAGFYCGASARWESDCCFKFKILKSGIISNKSISELRLLISLTIISLTTYKYFRYKLMAYSKYFSASQLFLVLLHFGRKQK
jgi:uncharacterized membrane protein